MEAARAWEEVRINVFKIEMVWNKQQMELFVSKGRIEIFNSSKQNKMKKFFADV